MEEKIKITERMLERIPELPSFPTNIRRIDQALGTPEATAGDIAEMIEKDPALTSNILKMANSSFYGARGEITELEQAVVRLGMVTVKSVVLGTSVLKLFGDTEGPGRFDVMEFWKHSIGCGSAARVIANLAGSDPGLYYLAGLLHDIGKIVLAKYFEEEFAEILQIVRERDCLLYTAEKEVLNGVGHPEIGGVLIKNWDLEGKVVRSTYYHHQPSNDDQAPRFSSVIHLSDLVVRSMLFGSGGDRRIPLADHQALSNIGFRPAQLKKIFQETDELISASRSFLNLIPE